MVHQVTEYYATEAPRGPGLLRQAFTATRRLILPVVLLLGVTLWADAVSDQPIDWFDAYFKGVDELYLVPSFWLTGGHLVLPFMFLVINLTNRRYGPSYATAQVTLTWAILGALIYLFYVQSEDPLAVRALPPVRTCVAFIVAIVFAQFANISLFDWTRGIPWWRAPLYAPIFGSLTYCALFYPSAFWGTGLPWVNQMVSLFGIMTAASFVLMVPYYLMRPMIKPLPGFGGA